VDVLVNISGHCSRPDLLPRIRRKVYVDLDPGYTQIWHSSGNVGARLDGHDDFFTVGANIGRPGCTIPTCGVSWRPVRQPVLLTLWPLVRTDYPERFTTIASWRGPLGTVEHDGEVLGPKVREFRKFVTLPELVPFEFEIALDIHPAESNDIQLLQSHGWQLADPRAVAENPAAFRSYVQGSSAECSVSQGVYVSTRSGWFSDRTTRYLASGKPALVQDTGFSAHIPTGDGLIAFTTLEQAAEGARRIVRDYAHHCQAARDLAERYFDSDLVLGQFLDELGLCP
jgi:hypothetical protein